MKKTLHYATAILLSTFLLGCSLLPHDLPGVTLPALEERTITTALTLEEANQTALGQTLSPLVADHPDKSGIVALTDALEAFAARLLLVENAEKTLDVQYYIWRNDDTGRLLLSALHEAAERGVRVRLLLDDLNSGPLEGILTHLHAHPNIEVRMFNPFPARRSRVLGFITDFNRANRRMHNKSFTADNQVTIIGGRNIGDSYFGAGEGFLFTDLDVLAIGPVVTDVSDDFDRFWSSPSAYPLHQLVDMQRKRSRYKPQPVAQMLAANDALVEFMDEVMATTFAADALRGDVTFMWAETTMVSDDPLKGLGKAEEEQMIMHQLQKAVGEPQHYFELISPYFVPTRWGVDALIEMAEQGVEIIILTNSLEATDVAIVHAGYAKWRKKLLRAGIRIFEKRQILPLDPFMDEEPAVGRLGSSAASLHAKTFAIDGQRVFVGSFNFDPRSALLNTELGFVIDSPELAQMIDQTFTERMPMQAYELQLSPQGRLYWLERKPGHIIRHEKDPYTTWLQRFNMRFFSLLPIDWLL
ncbi:phospholipase D family protein [Aliidiomarina haloalkalitolerans]|uniref:phospholipase D family protein n=1 Tax=Aliidiomarina haloalkalitolerans TaxID=859059 RepID=UPI001F53E937|nr:phospholipase D family protein [Aliidiomarina haloalkalitolerans]